MRASDSARIAAQLRVARNMGVSGKRRWNSTQSPQAGPEGAKPVSPHVGFYKTFARPIAKVLLMATFTYQLAYWGWVKLEKDEIKAQRTSEIEGLEKTLAELTNGKEKTSSP